MTTIKEIEFVKRHRYMATEYDAMIGNARLGWCRQWDEETDYWGFHQAAAATFVTSSQLREIAAKLDELNSK